MANIKNDKKIADLLACAHRDYAKNLNTWAFHKFNNREICKDLVQNTFMKTWLYLVKGGKINTMRAFLYHILNNLIIDEYRKNKASSLDYLSEHGFEVKSENFDRFLDFLDGQKALFLINKLPKKYTEILNLVYVKNLSIEEISNLTNQSKNNVTVQISRGLKKLREICQNQ